MDMPTLETKVIKLEDSIYAIDQLMVRSFLIVGDETALLLDTGAVDIDLMKIIRGITQKPVVLCMTHSDGDHTAALSHFQKAYIHPEEISLLMSKQPQPEGKLAPVEEGHVFDLGGRRLEVVFNPGHTPGSISLLDRENKLLFSGDTVSYGPVFMFGDHRNMENFKKSLEKLQKMADNRDFTVIYPCHNTCPVGVETIGELLQCVSGHENGTIEPSVPTEPLPPGAAPKLYHFKNSGIYCGD